MEIVDEKDKVGIVGRGIFLKECAKFTNRYPERLTLCTPPKTEFDLTLAWSIDRLTLWSAQKRSRHRHGDLQTDIAMAMLGWGLCPQVRTPVG